VEAKRKFEEGLERIIKWFVAKKQLTDGAIKTEKTREPV
jgi:dTDP-D-glucose 4,6-dehydratase